MDGISEASDGPGDCSNIVPSSESDPPPPVSYMISHCKLNDIYIPETENYTEGGSYREYVYPLNDNCSFGVNSAVERKDDAFTQAEDFQDISQESTANRGLSDGSCNGVRGVESARDSVQECSVNDETNQNSLKSVHSSSKNKPSPETYYSGHANLLTPFPNLTTMSTAEKLHLTAKQRESTPAYLGKTSLTMIGSQSNEFPDVSRKVMRSSEPPESFSKHSPMYQVESISSSLERLPDSASAMFSPIEDHSMYTQDSKEFSKPLSVGKHDGLLSTGKHYDTSTKETDLDGDSSHDVSRSPDTVLSLSQFRLSVHLSAVLNSCDSNGSDNSISKPIFLNGINLEFNTHNGHGHFQQLQKECVRMLSELSSVWSSLVSSNESDLVRSDTEQVYLDAEVSVPPHNIPNSSTELSSKPYFRKSTTTTSSSDLFCLRPVKKVEILSQSGTNIPTGSLSLTEPTAVLNISPTKYPRMSGTSSTSSDLFIPRAKNKSTLPSTTLIHPVKRFSSTSSSSGSHFINKPLHTLLRKTRNLAFKRLANSSTSGSKNSSSTSDPIQKDASTSPDLELSLANPFQSSSSRSFRPSLTLVSETPSEDTDDTHPTHRSIVSAVPSTMDTDDSNEFGKKFSTSDGLSKEKSSDPIDMIKDSIVQVTNLKTEQKDYTLVYGRWQPEKYYYAGRLYRKNYGLRSLVCFDDGSKARIRHSDILLIDLLPVGAEVCVDLNCNGEYWGGCLIQAHLSNQEQPYQILCRDSGEIKTLSRAQVAIHHSQVCHLRQSGILPSYDQAALHWTPSVNDSKTTLHPVSETSILTTEAKSPNSQRTSESPAIQCASPDVSLSNLVFGKRKSKMKRLRSSWITPLRQFSSDFQHTVSEPRILSQTHRSRSGNWSTSSMRSLPNKRCSRTSRPRRHLTSSVPRKRLHNISRSTGSQSRSNLTNAPKKKRIIQVQSDDENMLTQPMRINSPSPRQIMKPTNVDDPLSLKSRKSSYLQLPSTIYGTSSSLSLRRSLGRTLGIPTPKSTVFKGWTIILTGRSKTENVEKFDRRALEQLILACGGQVELEITPTLINKKEDDSHSPILGEDGSITNVSTHQYVALVAPDCCRTLKYFQALATLGQIPLLRHSWILESCRQAASVSPTIDDSDDQTNWPLQLLLSQPGVYELPRGFLTNTSEPVSWCSIPIRYRSPAYQALPPPSLFELQASWLNRSQQCRIIAIITNDQNVFGPAWLNILQIACGVNGKCNLSSKTDDDMFDPRTGQIPLISTSNAEQRLTDLLHSMDLDKTAGDQPCNLVLVDKTQISPRVLSALVNLPIRLVTCDFFIHSLICGYLVDPNSSINFTP